MPRMWPDQEYQAVVAEVERLRKIERAAQALRFSPYPAHGSGFVMIVSGGNINDLKDSLGNEGTEMVRPKLVK
jgi:hypothetical protein